MQHFFPLTITLAARRRGNNVR